MSKTYRACHTSQYAIHVLRSLFFANLKNLIIFNYYIFLLYLTTSIFIIVRWPFWNILISRHRSAVQLK